GVRPGSLTGGAVLDSLRPALASPDADGFRDREDDDDPVADTSGTCRIDDGPGDGKRISTTDHDLHLDTGKEVHGVHRSAVALGAGVFIAGAPHVREREPLDPPPVESFPNSTQPRRPNDRLHLLHGMRGCDRASLRNREPAMSFVTRSTQTTNRAS